MSNISFSGIGGRAGVRLARPHLFATAALCALAWVATACPVAAAPTVGISSQHARHFYHARRHVPRRVARDDRRHDIGAPGESPAAARLMNDGRWLPPAGGALAGNARSDARADVARNAYARAVDERDMRRTLSHESIAPVATRHASLFGGGLFGSGVVAEARRYIGTNPTSRRSLWCARFMNMVLERTGHHTTGSDMAGSFASYGQRVSGPQVGAIVVIARGGRAGHVGVVSGIDPQGNPVVISGNYANRVAEATYPRGSAIAYVMPD